MGEGRGMSREADASSVHASRQNSENSDGGAKSLSDAWADSHRRAGFMWWARGASLL